MIWWWWVAGAAVTAAGTLIARASSSSSSSSSTSGPSRDELKQAEYIKIEKEATQRWCKFVKKYEQLSLVHGQSGKKLYQDVCAAMRNDIRVAESFSKIAKIALLKEVSWENVLMIGMGCIRKVQNEHPQNSRSTINCLDILCGRHEWDPEPNADATLQSLVEIMAELQSVGAANYPSPAAVSRFVVRISSELPELFIRLHPLKSLLYALEHLELYVDTDIIIKYADSHSDFATLVEQWQVLSKVRDDLHPRVVVCGLLKAGKSTLLNMLTEHYDEECFLSARTRKTTTLQTELHKQIVYVDTPGLDAPEADEKAAWSAFASAEKVLFVISAEQDMEQTELKILQKLAAERSDFAEICTVVVTHMDALGHEEARHIRKRQSVREKILEATSADLPIFLVSSTTYCKGVREDKQKLRCSGGIDKLREDVQRLDCKTSIEARAERLNILNQRMRAPVEKELAEIENNIKKIEHEEEQKNKDMAAAMSDLLKLFRFKIHNYEQM